ncbi:ABC transporter permease, partial [candidate division KSB1 bacterium]|nr:ABC transporter permease [candidate division KSB1 bacterium]
MQRIAALVKKEFKQIRRDRAMLAIIFIMPVVQLILLGYVISSEVRNIALAVVDQDRSAATRQVIARIDHSGYFNIHRVDRYLSLLQEIDQNRATVGLVLPHGLDKNSQQGRETMVQILLDGQDSNTGIIALGYLSAILQDYIRERFATAAGAAIQPPVLTAETQYWFNADLDYSDYMVPGIAALLLTIVTSLLSAMGLVREREIGTLEQLLVTPIKKHELL